MSGTRQPQANSVRGVPDLVFDLVTVLQNKLQAISALEQYKEDAREANHPYALKVFEEMQQTDLGFVQRLRAMVSHELVVGLENQHGFAGSAERIGER